MSCPATPAQRRRLTSRPGAQGLVALWLLFAASACRPPVAAVPSTWVVFYGAHAPPEALRDYGLVVVDAGYQGRIDLLGQNHATVLAYLSLGEVNTQRPYFAAAEKRGLLVAENPNWPGAWMVDIRDARWRAMLVDEVATDLLARGFDGLFLDTADSALYLEQTQPARFGGMRQALLQLIAALHARHPRARLLLNGAVALAADLRGQVDQVAIESTLTTWDFASKTARWRTPQERSAVLALLHAARKANPGLVIYTLDYWNPDDRAAMAAIYRQQRADGFIPYVATLALDRVVPEPAAVTPTVASPASTVGAP